MKGKLEITKEEFDRKFNSLVAIAKQSGTCVPTGYHAEFRKFFYLGNNIVDEASLFTLISEYNSFMGSFCEGGDYMGFFIKPFRNSDYFAERLEDFRKIAHDRFDFKEEFFKIGDVVEIKGGKRLVLVNCDFNNVIALVASDNVLGRTCWRPSVNVHNLVKITAEEMKKIVGDEYGYKKINAKWSIEIHE